MTSVSVVIRCLNEEAHIERLLVGIREQSVQPDQIILVDSGSTDGTLSIAQRYDVELHSVEPASFSFGGSLNVGCQAAGGDVIVIASAHVYPLYDNWIEALVSPLLIDPGAAVSYGRQVGDRRTKFSEHQILAKWFPEASTARQTHPFSNNANAAIRRSAWLEAPYDERLTGLEDLDWANRALARGLHVAYAADAVVVHVHEETLKGIVNRYRREAIGHKRIFGDQRMALLEAVRLAIGNVMSDYYHAAREGVLLGNLIGIPVFRAGQFWGTYRGFAQQGEVSATLRRHFYYPLDRTPRRRVEDVGIGRRIEYGESPPDDAG